MDQQRSRAAATPTTTGDGTITRTGTGGARQSRGHCQGPARGQDPSVVNPNQLDYARRLRDEGETIAQIVTKTGITRTTLYRHLLPRPPESLTAGCW